MKKLNNLKLIFIFSATFLTYSCTDGFEELNTKNNLVTEDLVDVDLMFTLVLVNSIKGGTPSGTGTIGNYSGSSYSSANRPFQEGNAPGVWNASYKGYTNNLSDIVRLTKDDPSLINKTAIARIMKVWAFAKVTDTYGDIPYSQSNLAPGEIIFDPEYDTQQSIYEDFFKELKEAAASLDGSMESYGGADLVYGGNVEKWKKFANSLRLRLALRVRYVDEAMAKANMSDLQESDLIVTREDDASMYTTTDFESNYNSRYRSVLSNGSDLTKNGAGDIVNRMKEYNDPRIKIMADTAKAEFKDENDEYFGYRGTPVLGLVPVEYKFPWGLESSSRISDLWYVQVIEIPVLRSSEVYFALSEAALFGLKTGDAQGLYKKGMEASMNWYQDFYENAKPQLPEVLGLLYPEWTSGDIDNLIANKEITSTESADYLSSAVGTLTGSQEEQFEQIMVQKNIALYPLEYQNWAEWRRTGYPIFPIGPDEDDLNGTVPRRMPWPDTEATINSNSYTTAVGRLGTDSKLSKIWWDANPSVPYPWTGDPLPSQPAPWE